MGKIMYEYVQEHCGQYRQLMPVMYEKQDDGQFHKIKMACRNASECKIPLENCKHFQKAESILPADKLRDSLIP